MNTLTLLLLLALQDGGLRAGAATSNITPPLGQPIVGGWASPGATHIHDELHARCIVLERGGTRIAFAVCDNVGIPREVFDQARALVVAETGLPPSHLLMSATHTHSATSARGKSPVGGDPLSDYSKFLARRIADGVRRAINLLEPAQIAWGAVDAPEHVFNRRWHMKPGPELDNPFGGRDTVRMNPPRSHPNLTKPAGPTDPEVSFIYVRTRAGRPMALLANYSLHYVGGVPRGHVSADYFAIFARRVGELLGASDSEPPFVGIMTNGTSGDINNIDFTGKRPRRKPYEQMTLVATDVAAKVAGAVKGLEFRDDVPLAAAMKELTLAVRKPSPEWLERARAIVDRPEGTKPAHRHEEAYARRALSLQQAPAEVSVPLQALRIGDLTVAAIPFEVLVEIGLDLKKRAPLGRHFTISLANGSYGYLPPPEQHELGGYETWLGTNRVEIAASRKIAATLVEMMASFK